ncbi:MAG TPA: hypothetical protein VFI52_07115 [Gemmatimonadaceae bacterium]|nr:hypothetical protein [Gemmatimonadaceae bacterium]
MRRFWVTVALLVLPAAIRGQERNLGGRQPLGVRILLTSYSLAGDTTTLGYAVENSRSGGEDFSALLVAMPAPVIRMPKPVRLDWVTQPRYRRQAISAWVLVEDELLHPGQTSPELQLVARGLPDLVRYWAVPDLVANPPVYDDEASRDYYFTYSDTGTTVGIVPVPPGATTAALTARLRAFLGRACGDLGWITQEGVCQSLDVKLQQAQDALAAEQGTAARAALAAFANELDAQHGPQPGKHVNAAAHALLSLNAAYLLARS